MPRIISIFLYVVIISLLGSLTFLDNFLAERQISQLLVVGMIFLIFSIRMAVGTHFGLKISIGATPQINNSNRGEKNVSYCIAAAFFLVGLGLLLGGL